jgi:xanthine dehydrogenase iron-sulfur cluster and FAD-binding subunit A
MLATNILEKDPHIADEDLVDVLASNLCRCTGYQNIIKAVRAAAKEMRGDVARLEQSESREGRVSSRVIPGFHCAQSRLQAAKRATNRAPRAPP